MLTLISWINTILCHFCVCDESNAPLLSIRKIKLNSHCHAFSLSFLEFENSSFGRNCIVNDCIIDRYVLLCNQLDNFLSHAATWNSKSNHSHYCSFKYIFWFSMPNITHECWDRVHFGTTISTQLVSPFIAKRCCYA